MMRTLLALLIAAAGLTFASDVKDFKQTVSLDPKGRFSLETYKGSIHITPWDQPQAEIQARIEVDPGWNAAPAEDVDIRVDSSAGSVHVKSDYRHRYFSFNEGNLPLVHYTIRVPRGSSLSVKDYKSVSEIQGVTGDVEFETYKGTARLEGLHGAFHLNTYKGDVRAAFTAFTAQSHIDTYKGTIALSMPRSSAFEIHASLQRHAGFNCDFPRTIRSTHGDSEFRSMVNGGGPALRITSYRGDISLRAQ
jgi:hypothetical protein